MNFQDAVRHITRQKRLNKRVKRKKNGALEWVEYGALEWVRRFIDATPTKYSNDKKFLKDWFAGKGDLHWSAADFYRMEFAKWKREEKSRSAKHSGKHRKPRK